MQKKIPNIKIAATKNKTLSTKIAIVTSIILLFSFTILIFTTSLFVSKSIQNTLSDEFTIVSKTNGQQVQEVINKSATAAETLNLYISDIQKRTSYSADRNYTSQVSNTAITQLNHEMEQFILGTIRSTLSCSDEILGMGVLFEPYKFDSAIESYTAYLTDDDVSANNIQSLGVYADYSKNNYYQPAVQNKEPYITTPFVYDGINMITVSYPILYNGEVQGIVCCDISIDTFSKINVKNDKLPSLYATIFASDGTIVYQTNNPDNMGKSAKEALGNVNAEKILSRFTAGKSFSVETKAADGEAYQSFFYPLQAGNNIWWAQTAVSMKEMNQDVTNTVFLLVGLCVLVLCIVAIAITAIIKRSLKPIQDIVTAAEQISAGHLEIDLESKSNDEIGRLSTAFKATAQGIQTIIEDINYQLGEMAAGNFALSSKSEFAYVGEFNQILVSIRNINTNLSGTLSQINQASSQVNIGAGQVSSAAQALSQGSVEQASSIEELSATIAEIAEQVKLNAKNAQHANLQANEAGEGITESNSQMMEMIAAMSDISDKSGEIGKIIKTIEDIAFQTNILALNAAVEAARAGTAGKGFAVVADEVRNLATKSAEAAKNTTELIEHTVLAVENGSKIADNTANSLMAVVEKTNTVNSLIGEIAKASEDQSNAIAQVNLGVEQISGVVQSNSATAEESAAASEELNGQADLLKDLVNQFKFN
ncbi:methyl-accepting chemotaxis protein [Clostridium aminobutyricum]|uniref:HAMP domain-containing protein n=1 Tax=Clostridium aminobutyricum TaxID=33953 RepID=A0A939D9N8_CLOAM|nr:methyl-accepting chemotaxis protein [Clostridium aminobutyricum]MBN7773974.1 HAMP domain-containing protein [Clostridium aminobutyricum]